MRKSHFILPLLFVGSSFGNEIFNKYCSFNKNVEEHVLCKNLKLTSGEIVGEESISNSSIVVLEGSNIGSLNDRFFEKFPSVTNITFLKSVVNLTMSHGGNSSKIVFLRLEKCRINGNQDVDSLSSLKNLSRFELIVKKPSGWLEFPLLDRRFFESNIKLQTVFLAFEKNDTKLLGDFIEDGAFDSNQRRISRNFFKNNKALKELIIPRNDIEVIEEGALPESLEQLELARNRIENIDMFLTNLTNLKYLGLFGNQIKEVSRDAFKDLVKLKMLDLDMNYIRTIDVHHLIGMESLLSLFILGNKNFTFDEEIKEWMVRLEVY